MPYRRRPVNVAILLAGFALLLALMGGISWLSVSQNSTMSWVSHTLEVENRVRTVFSHLQDAETGQRGFLLTGRREFLEPYADATAPLEDGLKALRVAVLDNPRQIARVDRLIGAVHAREAL